MSETDSTMIFSVIDVNILKAKRSSARWRSIWLLITMRSKFAFLRDARLKSKSMRINAENLSMDW